MFCGGGATAIVCVLLLSACRAERGVSPDNGASKVESAASAAVTTSSAAVEAATPWRQYGADVEVTMSGGAVTPLAKSTTPPSMRYHLERTREADGVWASKITPDISGVGARGAGEAAGPATVDMRDDGARISMTDSNGNPYQPEKTSGMASSLGPSDNHFLHVPTLSATKGAAYRTRNPDAWLQAVLVDSSARMAIAQRLASFAVRSAALDRARYVVSRPDGGSIEIMTDVASGAITEESVYVGSRLAQHTIHRFEPRPGQVWVHTYTRTEVPSADGTTNPLVMERFYRNVNFSAGNK